MNIGIYEALTFRTMATLHRLLSRLSAGLHILPIEKSASLFSRSIMSNTREHRTRGTSPDFKLVYIHITIKICYASKLTFHFQPFQSEADLPSRQQKSGSDLASLAMSDSEVLPGGQQAVLLRGGFRFRPACRSLRSQVSQRHFPAFGLLSRSDDEHRHLRRRVSLEKHQETHFAGHHGRLRSSRIRGKQHRHRVLLQHASSVAVRMHNQLVRKRRKVFEEQGNNDHLRTLRLQRSNQPDY